MLNAFTPGNMKEKESTDIRAWDNFRELQHEDRRTGFLEHKISKLTVARKFLHHFNNYRSLFDSANCILEIGGGSCWASHIVKLHRPDAVVIASDIAPAAIESRSIWEPTLGVAIDQAFACTSYDIPVDDASVDLVFCFESAHHFGRHASTLGELARIVRPGGHVIYMDEPTSPSYFYQLVHRRNNSREDHVAEDVLIVKTIRSLAEENGFNVEVSYVPHTISRGEMATIYYALLRRMPVLAPYVPCTANFVMTRR